MNGDNSFAGQILRGATQAPVSSVMRLRALEEGEGLTQEEVRLLAHLRHGDPSSRIVLTAERAVTLALAEAAVRVGR